MRIVLGYPATAADRQRVAAAAAGADVMVVAQEDLPRALQEADLFCGHVKVPVPWNEIVAAGRLRWIQSSAAGLDHCLVPAVVDSAVVVSSASGVFADSVAEQTFALLLGLLRRLHRFQPAWSARRFERLPTDDLTGQVVGIVGLGGNGTRIAELLRPWRVRIVATDYFPSELADAADQVWGPAELPNLLRISSILILTAPLTEATDGLIGAQELQDLRPGSYLINVGRGRLVQEQPLVAALRSGHLAGAGLDVTPEEPPAPDSPLWTAPNLLVTPHVGAQSAERIARTTALFCDNLRRWQHGQRLINLVDKRLGFPAPADRWRGESTAKSA